MPATLLLVHPDLQTFRHTWCCIRSSKKAKSILFRNLFLTFTNLCKFSNLWASNLLTWTTFSHRRIYLTKDHTYSTQEKSKVKISLFYLKIPFLNFHCSLPEEEKSVGRGHRGTPLPWARSAAMSGVSQRLQAWRLPEAAAAAWWGQPQWPLGWL